MKAYDNGCFFTVSYTPSDCAEFSRSWPCSTVRGRGAFVFQANGDICDAEGTAAKNDGTDWLAFSEDCRVYGQTRLAGATPNKAMEAVYQRRHGE